MPFERLIGRYVCRSAARTLNFRTAGLDAPRAPAGGVLLYAHIPFCETLCPFCTFHRVSFDAATARRYFAALRAEIRLYADAGFRFNGVYFGGGTPTVLPAELARTLDLLRTLGMTGKVSVETNPNHLHANVIDQLRDAGVDRLSVGVQSFDDRLLAEMGRLERYGSGASIAERLAAVQGTFETLNADLIFNIPHQSRASLRRDIGLLQETGVDQMSYYPLMPASSTRRAMTEQMGDVDFSREKALYREILRNLQPHYTASSAWCFARGAAMIDEYIIEQEEYLGVGSGSFSYIGGTMYSTSFSIRRFIERVERGQTGIVMHRTFAARERLRYTLLVGLFGLSMSSTRVTSIHGPHAMGALWKELLLLKSIGAVRQDGDNYRLTESGRYIWLVMMREFLMGVNQFREQMRHHIRSEKQTNPNETRVPVEAIRKAATR